MTVRVDGSGWVAACPLPEGRASAGAAVGGDDRVYLVGGADSHGHPVRTVVAYDPVTDRWQAVAPLRRPRRRPGVAAGPDGRIFAFGGYQGEVAPEELAGKQGEVYDPTTDRWTLLSTVAGDYWTDPRAALGCDRLIYVAARIPEVFATSVSFEVFDPDSGSGRRLAPMPTPRYLPALAAGGDGRIYTVGGGDRRGEVTVEAYDPPSGQWAAVAPIGTRRTLLGATLGPDGCIYAAGGRTEYDDRVYYLADVDVFDVATRSWHPGPPLSSGRSFLAMTATADGVYAIGGADGVRLSATVEVLRP